MGVKVTSLDDKVHASRNGNNKPESMRTRLVDIVLDPDLDKLEGLTRIPLDKVSQLSMLRMYAEEIIRLCKMAIESQKLYTLNYKVWHSNDTEIKGIGKRIMPVDRQIDEVQWKRDIKAGKIINYNNYRVYTWGGNSYNYEEMKLILERQKYSVEEIKAILKSKNYSKDKIDLQFTEKTYSHEEIKVIWDKYNIDLIVPIASVISLLDAKKYNQETIDSMLCGKIYTDDELSGISKSLVDIKKDFRFKIPKVSEMSSIIWMFHYLMDRRSTTPDITLEAFGLMARAIVVGENDNEEQTKIYKKQ